MTTTAPQIQYTSRDYLSIRQDLLNAIPSFVPEWTSTSSNDFGIALLELFAWVADIDNFYIDRIANEAFLPTAQLRRSVLNLAYLIGYKPSSVQPAVASMALTLNAGTATTTLPAGTRFSTAGNSATPSVVFETPVDYTLPGNPSTSPLTLTVATASGQVVPITVVQGETVNDEPLGTSSGVVNQIFPLFYRNVIESSVTVEVDEGSGPQPWAPLDDLLAAGANQAAFALAADATGTFYILFGDNVHGRIPASGAVISSTYRTAAGSVGNVGAGQIIVDLSGTALFAAVLNPTAANGGSDPETNDQIRSNAPRSLTALHRCVSLQDYASVALGLPACSKASATSTTTASVVLYAHPVGGPYDIATLKSKVLDPVTGLGIALTNASGTGYLDDKKPAGTSVTVLPPTYSGQAGYLPVVIQVAVHVKPQYLGAQVQLAVYDALAALLDFGTMEFGALITQSAVYHAVMAVPGVDYAVVTEMRRYEQTAGTLNNIQANAYELIALLSPSVINVTTTGGL